MTAPYRVLHGYAEIVAAASGDPHARWGLDPATDAMALTRAGAVLWTVRRTLHDDHAWATAVGAPAAVAGLLVDGLHDLAPRPQGITAPFGTLALLPAEMRPPEHGDWTWWWTDAIPPWQDAEDRVVELDVTKEREELVALLAEASPTASAPPDDPKVRTWCGLRLDGRLVACAADRPYVAGIPHLASIATHPDARGRGYGGAVTAWLTRRRLVEDEAAVVTLGMYSANDAARSVYRRLGFVDEHRFTSGALPAGT